MNEYETEIASRGKNVVAHFFVMPEELHKRPELAKEFEYVLKAVIFDRQTGMEHETNPISFVGFEPDWDHWSGGKRILHKYFYAWHWCGCHRAGDMIGDVPEGSEDCPDERFIVSRLYCPKLPEIILMYETYKGTRLGVAT